MVISQMDHRAVRFGIKHGFTFSDFCAKYECDEADFQRKLRTLYRNDYEKMHAAIEANTRKQNRHRSGESYREVVAALANNLPEGTSLTPEAVSFVGGQMPLASSTANGSPAVSKKPAEDELALLKQQETELSDQIMELESRHKAAAKQHREHIRNLRKLREELDAIRQAFEAKATEYKAVVDANNRLAEQMNDISQSRSREVSKLTTLREQIVALTVIPICAYENGQIEAIDNTGIALDDQGSELLFLELRDQPELEELRIKDIRLLARVICIARNTRQKISPIFENEGLEQHFLRLNQSIQTA